MYVLLHGLISHDHKPHFTWKCTSTLLENWKFRRPTDSLQLKINVSTTTNHQALLDRGNSGLISFLMECYPRPSAPRNTIEFSENSKQRNQILQKLLCCCLLILQNHDQRSWQIPKKFLSEPFVKVQIFLSEFYQFSRWHQNSSRNPIKIQSLKQPTKCNQRSGSLWTFCGDNSSLNWIIKFFTFIYATFQCGRYNIF